MGRDDDSRSAWSDHVTELLEHEGDPDEITSRIACGDACTGDSPAVWMTLTTSPRSAAAWAKECTYSREATSTGYGW